MLNVIVALALLSGALVSAPLPVAADAAEWTVCASGCDFDSIQAAIDGAADGDSIKIATGTYTIASGAAQVAAITKSLTLRGGYSADFTAWDPELYPTTLDAQGGGRVIYINGAVTVNLDSLILLNGYHASQGAGVFNGGATLFMNGCAIQGGRVPRGDGIGLYQNGGTLTIAYCTIDDNKPTSADDEAHYGGGVFAFNATVAISDTTISNNRATNNGGIWHMGLGGGVSLRSCNAVLQRVAFTNNQANTYERARGGGLYTQDGTLSLFDSTFEGNVAAGTAGGAGGGAYLRTNNAMIQGNTFRNNAASQAAGLTGSGGGLDVGNTWENTTTIYGVQVQDNLFENNRASDGGGLVAKTAVSLTVSGNQFIGNSNSGLTILAKSDIGSASAVDVKDNYFQENTAYNGGGAYLVGAVNVLNNTFADNVASHYGGGIYQGETSSHDNATARYDGNLFQGNAAVQGGGLYLKPEMSENLLLSYSNMVLLGNTATELGSAFFYWRYAHDVTRFDHLTVAGNTGGDGSMIHNRLGNNTYTNCIFADGEYGVYRHSGTVVFDHVLRYDVTAAFYTLNNLPFTDTSPIEGDPTFAADGYHLKRGSAAIDAGTDAGLISDVDGDARPLGNGPDVGADESPYASTDSAIQAALLASEPAWRVYWTGSGVPPSTYLEQHYMLPYAYYGAESAPAMTSYTITNVFPDALELTDSSSLLDLTLDEDGNSRTWASQEALTPGGYGWISLTGESESAMGGGQLVSSGQFDYTLANEDTGSITFESTVEVPARPVYSPVLYTPLDGEICIEDDGTLSAKGVAGAGMAVRLYENEALKATTTADSTGQFTITWATGLDEGHDITINAIACEPGTETCSEPSHSVHLEYPESNWCPQRSYWEGDAGGTHHVFYFRNDQGRYATDDFMIPGTYGFWNTQLHLFSCCDDNDDNPFTVKADDVEYKTPSAHDGRWWTFTIGAAHDVTIKSQCYSAGEEIGEPKETGGEVLIDPDGFVFDVNAGGAYDAVTGMYTPQVPLAGMTVSCYQWVPEWESWVLWPADRYHQVNPQVTGADGYFAFFTPAGEYYIQVDAVDGFQSWRSPVVEVVSEIVHVNVPLTPAVTTKHSQVLLTPLGPDPEILYVPLNATVTWLAALNDEATAQDLADQMLNPVLRPYSLSPLDALSDTLGFDGGMLVPGQSYTRRFVGPGDYAYDDGLGHTGIIRVVQGAWMPIATRPD